MKKLVGKNKPFHSAVDKAAGMLKRKVGTGAEFMKELMGVTGIKPTEIQERGLNEIMGMPRMTHDQFMANLATRPAPAIGEKMLGGDRSEPDSEAPYHERYTLPGGDNYREMLIKLPKFNHESKLMEVEARIRRAAPAEIPRLERIRNDLVAEKARTPEVFQGVYHHFGGEPGILASMRLKDRTGPNGEKLLHLEELQSDWHQEGREKGYKSNASEDEVRKAYNAQPYNAVPFDELLPKDREYEIEKYRNSGVPDAPFKKNWEEMALKRLIHHAAEKGYHGIVVTPGAEQADRYSLAKYIDSVMLVPNPHPNSNSRPYYYKAFNKQGDRVADDTVDEQSLAQHIGKEAAEKLLAQEPNPMGERMISGANLVTGGEGMKAFYDKKVPNILNSIGKKYGVKTQLHGHNIETHPASIEKAGTSYYQVPAKTKAVHHFPITEEMRKDVLANGLPLYKEGGIIHKAEGGVMQATPAQMKLALLRANPLNLQSIGANEAPNMNPKAYLPPDVQSGKFVPPGGTATPSGMPIGGIDMSQQPGTQLVPQNALQAPQQPPQAGQQPSQPGQPPQPNQPPSNILSMTPQGQKLNAMQPQAPAGMADGGQPKKPLHYKPSPSISKAKIEQYAERMARQVSGLENPNEKTLQQLAREQNLPVEIRKAAKKQDVPIIDWAEKKGSYSVGVPGDPSRGGLVPSSRAAQRMGMQYPKAGEYLKSVGGEKLESPVPLYGGKDYGAYGHPEGWASDLGASAGMFNIVKRLAEEDPTREIYGHYHKMSPESLYHAVHMMDAVLSHHRPHEQSPEKIAELNRLMRDVATTTNKDDRAYPEFPGFENPNDVMFHGSLNSGMRKKLIKVLGTEKYFPGGKQKLADLIYAVSHPELRNIETGAGGSSILKFDPSRELRQQISKHPTYGHDIPSKLVGRTRYITPAEILAPRSMHNAMQEIKAMGKKVVPFNQAKMNIIREPIDEQYINQMGEYEHAMRKRLGYKKGGKVNKDAMRLAVTMKKAK